MSTTSDQEGPGRRHSDDRRLSPTPMLSRYIFRGGREKNRRASDHQSRYYVDRFGGSKLAAFVTVLILCGFDGVLTLIHVNSGGEELNPVMGFMLKALGGTSFLIIKYLLTALGMFFLLLHKNFGFVPLLIRVVVAGYVLIILYHIFIIAYRFF